MKQYRIICYVLLVLAVVLFLSCKENEIGTSITTTAEEHTDTVTEKVTIDIDSNEFVISKDSKSVFSIIRSENANVMIVEAAARLRECISDVTGSEITISDDWLKRGTVSDPEAYEILVGITNREETKSAEITEKGYTVKVIGKKILIYGDTDWRTVEAVEYFIENYVNKAENGEIHIAMNSEVTFVDTKSYFYDDINSENSYIYGVKSLALISSDSYYKYTQGGCTDGTYYYVTVIHMDSENQSLNRSILYKYDMSTWKVVASKDDLPLCHCNDLCYNPDTKMLYVANNSPENKKITIIDPETLEIKDNIFISDNIYSITYNPTRKLYIVGISGCENFAIYDSDFKRKGGFNGVVTGYVKQGIECDDKYIYVLYYKENCIMVYDWDGKYISRITLPANLTGEPEHLCVVDDHLIIGTNGSKMIYRLNVKKK